MRVSVNIGFSQAPRVKEEPDTHNNPPIANNLYSDTVGMAATGQGRSQHPGRLSKIAQPNLKQGNSDPPTVTSMDIDRMLPMLRFYRLSARGQNAEASTVDILASHLGSMGQIPAPNDKGGSQ